MVSIKSKTSEQKAKIDNDAKRHAKKTEIKRNNDKKRIEQSLANHPFLTHNPAPGSHGAPLPRVTKNIRGKGCPAESISACLQDSFPKRIQ